MGGADVGSWSPHWSAPRRRLIAQSVVQRHDPASDAFLSKPLPYAMGHMLRYQVDRFNLGVIPMPYVDNGASVFGDVWIRDALQIWYAAYAVNGFTSGTPRDFTFKNLL